MLGIAPYTLILAKTKDVSRGDQFITDIETIRQSASAKAFASRQKRLDKINKGRSSQNLQIGDWVRVAYIDAKKLDNKILDGVFEIVKILGDH